MSSLELRNDVIRVALAFVLNLACQKALQAPQTSNAPDRFTPTRARNVEWAGCTGIRRGPVCVLGAHRTLTVWLEGPSGSDLSLVSDRREVVAARTELNIDHGTRWTVDVPLGSHFIALEGPDRTSAWSLSLEDAKGEPEIDRWVALGRTGKYAEAVAGLERFAMSCSASERGPAHAAIGRMSLALGEFDRAEPALRAAMGAARTEGRVGDAIQDGAALIWAQVWLKQDFVEARRLLDEMNDLAETYPEGRVWLDFHHGLLAASTGDVRTALERYRSAQNRAARLRLDALAESASTEIANQLTAMGRVDEALTRLRASPGPREPCARATWALNLAWTLTKQVARSPDTGHCDPEVTAALRAAEASTRACPDPHRRVLAAINASEYALDVDSDVEIAQSMKAMQATPDLPAERGVLLASWRADVLGRWRLRQGRATDALQAFEEQARTARGAGLLEEAFRGQVGAGRALLALGRRARAVSRWKAAQELLERMLQEIPLGEGRGGFLGGHDDAVRYLVATLVDGRAFSDALRVARWARVAELAHASRLDRLAHLSPDARHRWDEATGNYRRIRNEIEHQAENDWMVPRAELARLRRERERRAQQGRDALDQAYRLLTDDRRAGRSDQADDRTRDRAVDARVEDAALPEPSEGEVYLAFFPGVGSAWYAFAATPRAVRAQQIDRRFLSSAEAAADVLAAFTDELAGARRVRLLPYGDADRIDWHAVRWQGRPLIASVEVEYGLDLRAPAKASLGLPADAEMNALVIADPGEDLPLAVPEADSVVRALAGWQITRLDGGKATREATLAALSGAKIFHYAGHAEITGVDGFSSALLLKGDARIELGDLLAAPAVPLLVVLSACEAAGTAARHPSLLGLAQAFVAAGTRIAIAPTRPIADAIARRFVAAFYNGLVSAKSGWAESVHAAFRSAALRISEVQDGQDRNGDGDWQSLRLLVP